MKKIFSFSVALLTLALGFVACNDDDDDYQAGVPTSTQQVYFSNAMKTTIEISPSESSFQLPILRGNAAGALTVALNVTVPEGSIFSAPSQVSFADGSKQANIEFSYDPTKIQYGRYDTITVAIADASLATQYGLSSFTFTAGVTDWKAMEGKGYYREDFLTAFFGVDNIVIPAEFEENFIEPGKYRIKNLYGADYPYNDPGDWFTDNDYYLTINAVDPTAVYVERSNLGFDWTYGEFSISSYAYELMAKGQSLADVKAAHPEYFGTLVNGIITMPANSLLIAMADYPSDAPGSWYTSNPSGLFCVALPGYAIADYGIEFTKDGVAFDAANNEYVKGILTLGPDVESASFVVAPISEDGDSILAGLMDGSIEGQEAAAGTNKIEGAVKGSGNYAIYVVAFAGGEAVNSAAVGFIHRSPAETWTTVGTGTYKYTTYDYTGEGGVFDVLGTTPGTLYQCNENPDFFLIAPWCISDDGMVFSLNEVGEATVLDNYTGYTDEDYGPVYGADLISHGIANIPSGYESESSTFYFELAYFAADGDFAYVEDQFVLDAASSARFKSICPKAKAHRAASAKARGFHKLAKLKKKYTR